MGNVPVEKYILKTAEELCDGDKFLAEELHSAMWTAHAECVYSCYGIDNRMEDILKMAGMAYAAGRKAGRYGGDIADSQQTALLKAELRLSESRIDHSLEVVDNWKALAEHYEKEMKYWYGVAKEVIDDGR